MKDTPLLKFESNWMMQYQWPITTVQIYEGDANAAAEFLRGRLAEVARLNPWMGGKLIKDPKRHGKLIALRYNPGGEESPPPVDEMFEFVVDDAKGFEVGPYEELAEALKASEACVPNGNGLIKSGRPVCKLTVSPRKDEKGGFAVIFSMSHTVADGHTYYAILNMLSSAAVPFAMKAERDEKFQDGMPRQIGEEFYEAMLNPGLPMMVHYLGIWAKAKRVKPLCFFIDEDKLKAAKESAAGAGAEGEEPAPYVSTNDIVTSGFGRAVNARMLTMAINFRGRMDGLTAERAGNYHSGLIWGPDGYATPNKIRRALDGPPPLSRGSLPGGCCVTGNWTAMISNWSSLSRGHLDIPGCAQTLHLPYLNTKEMMEDSCFVFKARPGEVAVMLFLQNATLADVKKELPLGEPVSPEIFGC